MGIFNRRQARKLDASAAQFQADHEAARTNPAAMRALLMRDKEEGFSHPWLLTDDRAFRNGFHSFYKEFCSNRRMHSTLLAHYERLQELTVETLFRFVSEDYMVSPEQLETEIESLLAGFKRLAVLNDEAWDAEAKTANVSDSVQWLLEDAEATVVRARELA